MGLCFSTVVFSPFFSRASELNWRGWSFLCAFQKNGDLGKAHACPNGHLPGQWSRALARMPRHALAYF